MVIQSYAKVNLYLEVLNKRPDNYHNLITLLERINLADTLVLKNRSDNLIRIRCSDPAVPLNESNICWQAARLLQDKFGVKKGLDIKITKRIPVAAGLGGGSSNAAGVLTGLNKLWRLGLSKARLAALGASLGSDVPFFIYDAPFALGEGRGEKVRVLKQLGRIRLWHVLVVPGVNVSTPLIYKKYDAFSRLTKPGHNVKIIISKLAQDLPNLKPGLLFNSLEPVTLRSYPQVRRLKQALAASGLKHILMSGSGGAVFAIVPAKKEAVALVRKLQKERKSWRAFAVSTV